jgi:hypothetical protein
VNDAVNHPSHYRSHPSGVEAIDICEHCDFILGNSIKYLFRCGHKDPVVQDLSKSAWYLRRALAKTYRYTSLRHGHIPLSKVITWEPPGSVLRDVLELTLRKMVIGDPPRVADALARVEREIAELSAKQ